MYAPVRRFYKPLKIGNIEEMNICKNTGVYLNPVITGGVAPYTYQWYKNGVIIDTEYARQAAYPTPGADATDSPNGTTNIYKLVVQDSLGNTAQNEFTVTVPSTLTLVNGSTQTISASENTSVALQVETTGGRLPLTYRWRKNLSQIISEATTDTFVFPASEVTGNSVVYDVMVTDVCNTSKTKTFMINVVQPLSVTLSSVQTCPGTAVTLNPVVSGGVTPYTYQWYKNNALISGANSATYTTSSADSVAGSSTIYKVVVTDARSQTVNKMAAVSVPATLTISNGETWNILPNETVNFYPNVIGGKSPLTYQWYKNDVAIANATGATYTTDSADAIGGATNVYKLVVTDDCGNTVNCENTVNVGDL